MPFLDQLIVHIEPLPKTIILQRGEVVVVFRNGRYYGMGRGKATRMNLNLPITGKPTGIKFDLRTGSHEVTLTDAVLLNEPNAEGEPHEARVTVAVSAQVSLNADEASIREWVEEFRLSSIDSGAALHQTFERSIRSFLSGVSYDDARQHRFDTSELVAESEGTFLRIHRIDRLDVGADDKIEHARRIETANLAEAKARIDEERERTRFAEQRRTEAETGVSPVLRDDKLFDRTKKILERAAEYQDATEARESRLLGALIQRLEDARHIEVLSETDLRAVLGLDDRMTNQVAAALRELGRQAAETELTTAPGSGGPAGLTEPTASLGAQGPRYLEARAPAQVRLGDAIGVQLRVALTRPAESPHVPLLLAVPPEGLRLLITSHTPGFELQDGGQLRELVVPSDRDSDWILYALRAIRQGVHDLVFTVFHPLGGMLAELAVQVSVDAAARTGAARGVTVAVESLSAVEGEVSLMIDWVETEDSYRFQLFDRALADEVPTARLKRSPRQVVEMIIRDLDQMAKGRFHGARDVRTELRDRGVQLWSELIPRQLQEQFWDRQSSIKYLRIAAKDDPIPWEILYPLAAHRDEGFLVEQFPVVRWVRGMHPLARIGDGSIETVLPSRNAPRTARNEVERVRSACAPRRAGTDISDLPKLRERLSGGDFGIMHFACHNAFDPADSNRATIKLGDEDFTPLALAPLIATGALQSARPLVFLNACRTAARGSALYGDGRVGERVHASWGRRVHWIVVGGPGLECG